MTGAWTISRLGPIGVLALLVAAALALPAVAVIGCAAHEVGHALAGTALGYEVERIVLCPAAAEVVWRASAQPPIDATLVPWAGGLAAAGLMAAVYALLVRGGRPARSPVAWALGLPIAAVVGIQLAVGVLEGLLAGRYVEAIDAGPWIFVPLILGFGLVGAVAHLVAWRQVLR